MITERNLRRLEIIEQINKKTGSHYCITTYYEIIPTIYN